MVQRLWLIVGLVLASVSFAHAVTVTLAWDYVQGITPATEFALYKQPGCTGLFVRLLPSVLVPTQVYVDTDVVAGQTYCWYVTALSAAGQESGTSNTLLFQVPLPPGNPVNLRGTLGP